MRDCDLPMSALENFNLFSGVLALESAGYFHKMNLYGVTPIVLMSGVLKEISTPYIRHVPRIFQTCEGLVHLGGKLYVTTPERTVCELAVADGDPEFIYDTLVSYLAHFGTKETLLAHADKFGCREQVQSRIDTFADYMNTVNY
ncbi:hypothetical protein FACS1894208_02080 [Clostridia bacterium]|nr:hypothetical protein FACS1894208_02080 [Clostridia bacterium]